MAMAQQRVLVVGCGIVGAMIAYELGRSGLDVTVCERSATSHQGASGAALGVLMAVCSSKATGGLVRLRLASLRKFDPLIQALNEAFHLKVPYKKEGIVCLYEKESAQAKWERLMPVRSQQGFEVQWWSGYSSHQVQWYCQGALFSPHDRWVHPQGLTEALVSAAQKLGVKFFFDQPIENFHSVRADFDFVVVSAGMGSNFLIGQELLQPVQGLAVEVYLPDLHLIHVLHIENCLGEDINIVPLPNDRLWIGATVEFNLANSMPSKNIEWLLTEAIRFCPYFQSAQVIRSWQGDRPRPQSLSAPIIGFWDDTQQIILATGHYRNGVLMSPITAEIVKDLILKGESQFPYHQHLNSIKNEPQYL